MILPPGIPGVAFGDASDGDPRHDPVARDAMAQALGIDPGWAWIDQVHGTRVVVATGPGSTGEADAVLTTTPMLPLAVGTADCFPVALVGRGVAGLAHAGWRGTLAGVVGALRDAIHRATGSQPEYAAIGPGIGPCCFEVGDEVALQFPWHQSTTTAGAVSVDLRAALADQLAGIPTWVAAECTMCGEGWNSHRRDRTPHRQVAVAWLPA